MKNDNNRDDVEEEEERKKMNKKNKKTNNNNKKIHRGSMSSFRRCASVRQQRGEETRGVPPDGVCDLTKWRACGVWRVSEYIGVHARACCSER